MRKFLFLKMFYLIIVLFSNQKILSNLILVKNDIFEKNEINSDLGIYLKLKLLESDNSSNLSCRKLANLFFIEKRIKISKSTANNFQRKELNYHYLKTCCKSNFLKKNLVYYFTLDLLKVTLKLRNLDLSPFSQKSLKYN